MAQRIRGKGTRPDDHPLSWAAVVEAFADDPEVHGGTGNSGRFGTNGLRVNGKIFAMPVGEDVVLKLPKERARALVEGGNARPFEMKARVMKEWIVLDGAGKAWLSLACEAKAFVQNGKGPSPRRSRG